MPDFTFLEQLQRDSNAAIGRHADSFDLLDAAEQMSEECRRQFFEDRTIGDECMRWITLLIRIARDG